jgi:hypothetical protein
MPRQRREPSPRADGKIDEAKPSPPGVERAVPVLPQRWSHHGSANAMPWASASSISGNDSATRAGGSDAGTPSGCQNFAP